MQKRLLNLLLISFFIGLIFAEGYDISKGRYYPEVSALGSTGVAGFSIPNAIQLNPANIAHYNGWNNYWYGANFENALSHNDFTMSFQLYDLGLGFSYINQKLADIPYTDLIKGRIRQNGSFSEYITQTQLHTAMKLTNLFLFKEIDLGATIGLQQYSFMSGQDMFVRFGTVFSLDLVPDVYFGCVLNDSSEKHPLIYGLQYRQPDYKVFVDNGDKGLAVGGEYSLNQSLLARGGLDTDFFNLGLGLKYEKLYFFGKDDMGINFDYTLQIPLNKYPFESQHLFGITVREQDKLPVPFLYEYPPFTNKKFANVIGWSLTNTNVQIFYKDILIDMVKTNANGYWEAKLPLSLEVNDFYFKAIQKGPRKESLPSKKYRIIVDQIPPDFRFEAFVKAGMVTLDVYPNEVLANPPFFVNLSRSTFFNTNKYSIEAELESVFDSFTVRLQDNAKNEAILTIEEPFINFSAPQQSMVVTYKDKHQFVGSAGIYHNLKVKNPRNSFAEDIPLVGKRVTVFKPIVPLEYGINQIIFTDEIPKGKINYSFSVFRLFNYKDIENKEADLLATCFVLPREDLFEPLKRLRQYEVIKWVMSLWNTTSVFSAKSLTFDEAYNLALKARLIKSREDMRYLNRGEAMDIISRAFNYPIYNSKITPKYFENVNQDHPYIKAINYFVENGFIDIKGRYYDPDVIITRQELLGWLTKSSYFLKIKRELEE